MWDRLASDARRKRRCLGGTGLRLFAKEILDDRLQRAHDLLGRDVGLVELQRESEVLLTWLVAEHVVTRPSLRRLRLSLLRHPSRVLARRTTAFVLQPLHQGHHFLQIALTNYL